MNVWIIRNADTSGATMWSARAGNQGNSIRLPGGVEIKRGDRLTADVWEETRVAARVFPTTDVNGNVVSKEVEIVALSEWLAQQEAESHSNHQTVCGNVGSVAAHDVIQAHGSFVEILSALEKTITEAEIPTEAKASLLSKIRDLINNPRLRGRGTILAAKFLKRAAGG